MAGGDQDWGEAEERPASIPALVPVTYGGPTSIAGDAATVASIHKNDRKYDLFETLTRAGLAIVGTVASTLLAIFAPQSNASLFMAISGWVLSFGLAGFATFRLRLSKSGLDMMGKQLNAGMAGATQQRTAQRKGGGSR